MHSKAHGEVPNTIIEVDSSIVESFLGRIEDPNKSQKKELNIVNNPAFRILAVLKIVKDKLQSSYSEQIPSFLNEIRMTVESFEGRIVRQSEDYVLISYNSTTNALKSTIAIRKIFSKAKVTSAKLHIGVSAGLPVTKEHGLFEETIKIADRLSAISRDRILITSEVKDLYQSENLNRPINKEYLDTISLSDERFLTNLNDYLDNEWLTPTLSVDTICANLGFSASQLYRKMTSLTKKSTNTFIQDFRLDKALKLLRKKDKSISEIAFETGFNSPGYFTQCFQKKYQMLPSTYTKSL